MLQNDTAELLVKEKRYNIRTARKRDSRRKPENGGVQHGSRAT